MLGAGPPKQFAVCVGVLFSAIIVILEFTKQWQAATVFAAILAFFAGLESFFNFCAGCWFFGHAIRLGFIPDTVYMIHINSLPETKYVWNEWTKVVNPEAPTRVEYEYQNHTRRTAIDLHYKTGKTDDWEREDFAIVSGKFPACARLLKAAGVTAKKYPAVSDKEIGICLNQGAGIGDSLWVLPVNGTSNQTDRFLPDA